MKELAIINGGKYTKIICETLNPDEWTITEWEIIPMIGGYDLVIMFLDDILNNTDLTSTRVIKREFMEYIKSHPTKWIIFAPTDSVSIRRKGIMKNHHRSILDACRFGYEFKKRFRCWSSFFIKSVLCNRSCLKSKYTKLHDVKNWTTPENVYAERQIELLKKYDELNVIPHDLIRHLIDLAQKTENSKYYYNTNVDE